MIISEQIESQHQTGNEPKSKIFFENYYKKLHGGSPEYETRQLENGKFVAVVTFEGKEYEGEERSRKIMAEESAAEVARKALNMWFEEN